jgi:spermidine/putrescine-binding protein
VRILLLLALVFGGCSKKKPELIVLTWSDYFAEDTIGNFEKEFDCVVKVNYITDSDEIRVLLAGGGAYDVVFPSDDAVRMLIGEGRLQKLDASKLPNLKNLSPKYRGLDFDPRNEYTVPYMWGTTGIAYHKEKVSPPPDSWTALWDAKYTSKMTMLDDWHESFIAAMYANGDDPSKPTAESIDRAKKKLLERRPMSYDSAPKKKLVDGDAWLSHVFSGDAIQGAVDTEGKIGFVIPKEGATLWIDNLAVPTSARNRDLAHAFINYILRPEVSAAISNTVRFANPNDAARPHIAKDVLEDPMVYPSDSDLARCRLLAALPPDLKKRMQDAWAEIKAK